MRYEFDSIYRKLFNHGITGKQLYEKQLISTKMLDILSSTCNSTHANTLLDSRSV